MDNESGHGLFTMHLQASLDQW